MSSGKDSGREGEKTRSKDTWQSNTGYLAIYPWIHCKVSLDTFSGYFSALRLCPFLISLGLEKTVIFTLERGQERQLKPCNSKASDN